MVLVKLENGRTINFEGTPTQADIDEVVATMDIQPVEPTQAKSFLRPRELATSIFETAKKEFGGAAEDIQAAQKRQAVGEQGFLRTGFTALAQGAQAGLGTAFGAVIDIASAALPDFIENPLRRKIGAGFDAFIASESGQKLVRTIQSISETIDTLEPKNQQLVKDIADAALTGVDITAFGVGGKAARRGLVEVGAEAGIRGRGLVTRAEKEAVQKVESNLVDLVIDTSTPSKRTAIATRTKEGGFFRGREITPTASEKRIMEELIQTPGIKVKRSALLNLNAVTKAVEKEAGALKTSLKENNFIFPKKEANSRLITQLDELKNTDTDIIGDSERLADRIFDKAKVFINDSDGTGLGALQARQNFDRWVITKRPKAFEKQDAFNTAVRSARNTINDFLAEKATKTDVKRSLQRQSRLISAQDVLKIKAGRESATGFIRLLDRATEVLGTKSRIVQILAAGIGIGGLGAAATFAPVALAIGGIGAVVALLIKALKSPASRKALGNVLIVIEKALPKAKGQEKAILTELRDELKALLDNKDVDLTKNVKK